MVLASFPPQLPLGSPVGREMAGRVRAHDWAKTPLGPAENWSSSLTMMVDVILGSGFPMAVRWGPDFCIIYNDGYLPILGDKHPWALGLPFREAWPEVQPRLAPLHEEILAGSNPGIFSQDLPLNIRRRGDAFEEARFTVGYSPIPDPTVPSGVGGVLITAVETTERVRVDQALRDAEAALRKSNDTLERERQAIVDTNQQLLAETSHLRALFEQAPGFIAVLRGPEHVFELVNASYTELIGDRHVTGKAVLDALPEIAGQGFLELLDRVYLSGEPFVGHHIPVHLRTETGASAEKLLDFVYQPIFGAGDVVTGIFVEGVDVTERVRAEADLRKLNETLEAQIAERTRERDRIWRVAHNLLGVASIEGRLLSVNPAWTEVLGWSESELLAMSFKELRHPDDYEQSDIRLARIVKGSIERNFEIRYRHKNGGYRSIYWSAVPEDGVIYVVGRDVTAERDSENSLRHAEDALRQAQKMEAVGQLTGGLAHDFNNILTGVIGSLEMIQTRITQGRVNEIDRYAKAATMSAHRAAALTHRLLAFARRQPLDPKPVNVDRLVMSMEDLLRRTTGEGLQLEFVTPGGLWPTFCDPNQLENVVLNLVINARDAMPSGGKVTIETINTQLDDTDPANPQDIAAGQYVCLSVADTGVGMSAETISRAFDPFFTTKPIGQGTGLGLSMVYGFAKQSEGHARITSVVGEGTTVRLYLPRFRGVVADETSETGRLQAQRGDGETVLVIEDDPVVRELVTDILDELGYRALEAGDGRSGLNILLSQARIDLLITDVGLPEMNGRQVADAARERRPDLKVLFMTGYAENVAISNGFLDPGMEMVTKPFAIDALAARIRAMIEG